MPTVDKQSGGDPAALGCQYVVGAAGGLRVHHLESDAGIRQWTRQTWLRKALPGAGSQKDDLAAQIAQVLEVAGVERFEACDRPGLDLIGGYDHMGGVSHPVDFNKARTVRSNGVLRGGRVGVQLQIVRNLRLFEYIIGTPRGAADV